MLEGQDNDLEKPAEVVFLFSFFFYLPCSRLVFPRRFVASDSEEEKREAERGLRTPFKREVIETKSQNLSRSRKKAALPEGAAPTQHQSFHTVSLQLLSGACTLLLLTSC